MSQVIFANFFIYYFTVIHMTSYLMTANNRRGEPRHFISRCNCSSASAKVLRACVCRDRSPMDASPQPHLSQQAMTALLLLVPRRFLVSVLNFSESSGGQTSEKRLFSPAATHHRPQTARPPACQAPVEHSPLTADSEIR